MVCCSSNATGLCANVWVNITPQPSVAVYPPRLQNSLWEWFYSKGRGETSFTFVFTVCTQDDALAGTAQSNQTNQTQIKSRLDSDAEGSSPTICLNSAKLRRLHLNDSDNKVGTNSIPKMMAAIMKTLVPASWWWWSRRPDTPWPTIDIASMKIGVRLKSNIEVHTNS